MVLSDYRGVLDKRLNLEAKKRMVEDLRRTPTADAVSALAQMLRDESWYLRELAIDALAERGRQAVPYVLPLLASGVWYTRAAAALTLGRVGASEAAAPVVRMLTAANRTVAEAAVESLTLLASDGGAGAVASALARGADSAQQVFLTAARSRNADVAERVASLIHGERDERAPALGALEAAMS